MKNSIASDGQKLLHGVKHISSENWQQPDLSRVFEITGEEWIGAITRPTLDPNVPEEVVKLFEIARGAMVYGCYY